MILLPVLERTTLRVYFLQIKANLTSNIYVINSFLDLIRNGSEKKIVFISSPSGDVEFNRVTGITAVLGYGAAKAGMNIVMTKFGADLAPEGIKTLSLSPGWVDTDAGESIYLPSPNQVLWMKEWDRLTNSQPAKTVTGDPEVRKFMLSAFHKLDKTVEGPIPVAESVASQLQVIKDLTQADSGKFLTRLGNSHDWF